MSQKIIPMLGFVHKFFTNLFVCLNDIAKKQLPSRLKPIVRPSIPRAASTPRTEGGGGQVHQMPGGRRRNMKIITRLFQF